MPLPHSLSAHQRGRLAYQRAQKAMPLRWYEARYLPYIVIIPLMYVLFVATLSRYHFSPPVWLSIIGVSVSVMGWWFDTITTHQSMKLRRDFDRRGLHYPSYEMNPLTRETRHLLLQVASPSTLLALLSLPVTWLFLPGFGIAVGVGHVLAGIANDRHTRRMHLNLLIYDELYKGRGERKENGRETHSEMLLAGPFQLVIPN